MTSGCMKKKYLCFSTVNIIIDNEEYTNNIKMTSPDAFELQRLLKVAKSKWCEVAVIETASHWIKMHRVWWIEYDTTVLTNISQDHLDLHKTMNDYVNTKLTIFKNLISYKRKPWVKKTAVINLESEYANLFLAETYDSLFSYWMSSDASLAAKNIKKDIDWMKFTISVAWPDLEINTSLRWEYNVYNILAAVWVFISFWIKTEIIQNAINNIKSIPWRMEEIKTNEWYKIFVDYAHTPDALENVLSDLKSTSWIKRVITVFWATWDRDKTKRPVMGEIVSRLSDIVILTQDDDYTEKTEDIMKDVLPGIERKEWDNFWMIADREEAIRTALISAKKSDVVLIAWKWDEHSLITNDWPIKWHDKEVVKNILQWIDDNKIIN